MRHIEVGAARLAVEDTGGTGPALIALHAGVADSRAYGDCVPRWADAGWRVIRYDRRGFGASEWREQPFSHVEDLLAVMDALSVPSAVLVGNSQGGRIALDTTLSHPDRVAGLLLIGTAITGAPYPFGDTADPREDELGDALDAAEEGGDLDLVNRLEAHAWLDGPRQSEGRVGGAARELFLDMNGTALAAPATGDVRWPESAWSRADTITTPTLVVIGAHDFTLFNERSRDLARRMPAAELIELPASAHLPMLDAPDDLLTATGPFLDAVRTAAEG